MPKLAQTIDQVAAGRTEMYETIVRYYEGFVFSVAVRVTFDRDLAYDVTQDTFLKLYGSLSKFRGESRLSSYLYRIATNAARDQLRRRRLLTWLPLFDEDPALLVDSPEAAALELHAVEQALLKLDPDLRVPLVLYTCQELSTQEIADVLGISRDAVKQRLVRARLRFRELYEK